MHASGKRRAIIRNNGVVAGSVWDTRIKMDEFEGGIKVFNAGNGGRKDEGGMRMYRRLRRNQSDAGADTAERRKRRSWKPPEPVGSPCIKNHGMLRKARSELSTPSKSCDAKEEEEEEEEDEIEIEDEEEVKSFDDKEIVVAIKKPEIVEEKLEEEEEEKKKAKNVVVEEIHPIPDIPILPNIEKEQNHVEEIEIPASIGVEEEMFETTISGAQNKMQNIVDLVMWRDISKSAFVFGFGSFLLLSSSYAKDLNFSLISAISYLGLVYLAMIFLYKSILRRGSMEFDERNERLIGEEEAIWALRFLLPYINEVLLKMRSLFSGDPATTMKLALLLFALARSGGSITTWTLAKLIFFGVFTIPKVLSTYSVQLAKYGKFWLQRFRDGWESCTHKKAVAAGVFTVIWNLSSTVARIWAVFMLVVAVKLYQQCVVAEQWNGEEEMSMEKEEERQEDSKAGPGPGSGLGQATRISIRSQHRQRNGPRPIDVADRHLKLKKWT